MKEDTTNEEKAPEMLTVKVDDKVNISDKVK